MKEMWDGRTKRRMWLTFLVTRKPDGFMDLCFFVTDPGVVNPTNLAVYFGQKIYCSPEMFPATDQSIDIHLQ
jgi:hypothetical protein